MPTTPVDQDKLVDLVAADDHARKLVGVKAKRDLNRFLAVTDRPLSFKETLAAAVGGLLAFALLIAAIVVLSK
jgi:hypothetical protein